MAGISQKPTLKSGDSGAKDVDSAVYIPPEFQRSPENDLELLDHPLSNAHQPSSLDQSSQDTRAYVLSNSNGAVVLRSQSSGSSTPTSNQASQNASTPDSEVEEKPLALEEDEQSTSQMVSPSHQHLGTEPTTLVSEAQTNKKDDKWLNPEQAREDSLTPKDNEPTNVGETCPIPLLQQQLENLSVNDSPQDGVLPFPSPSLPCPVESDPLLDGEPVVEQASDHDPQQDEHIKIIRCLLNSERTVNIQYLQLCFIGLPCVGKTTLRNRLLKVPASSTDRSQGTPVASYDQILTLVKGSEWYSFESMSAGARAVIEILGENEMSAPRNTGTVDVIQVSRYEVPSVQAVQPNSKLNVVIDLLRETTKEENDLKFGELLGSIFLNVHDFGGCCIVEMLPALIHGPAMYFVCFNMSEELDSKVSESGEQKYSTKETIFKILSSIASIQCMPSKPSALKIGQLSEFWKKFDTFSKISPTVVLIGTHKDKVAKDIYDEECKRINGMLFEMCSKFRFKIIRTRSKAFFPVNNLDESDSEIAYIRRLVKRFTAQFKHVALPIQPNWLIFGIILRREFHIIAKSDCLEIGKQLRMSKDEVEVCLCYLHYCVGTLVYFPHLGGWFENHVICSPQIVFNSIDRLILRCLQKAEEDDMPFFNDDGKKLNEGQFSLEFLETTLDTEFPEVLDQIENNVLIPVENLICLLKYVHLLSPINSADQVTYLMPTTLKHAPHEEMICPPTVDSNNPEPLFIVFECGYVPTGVFCRLITDLVSSANTAILGMEWKLNTSSESNVKQNRVSFFIHEVNIVTLLCHERCYEIRLVRRQKGITLHDLCTHVLSVILYMLNSICNHMSPMIAFQCRSPTHKHAGEYHFEHLCVLKWGTTTAQNLCENSEVTLSCSQEVWIGKHVSPGRKTRLEVLKYVHETDLSFCWIRHDSESSIKRSSTKSNILSFEDSGVDEEDYCCYQCQVMKDGNVIFTTYRALFKYSFAKELKMAFSSQEIIKLKDCDQNEVCSLEDLKGIKETGLNDKRLETFISSLENILDESISQRTVSSNQQPKMLKSSGGNATTTIEQLIEYHGVNIHEIDCEIANIDIIFLAEHFDNVDYYLDVFKLSTSEKVNVKKKSDNHLAMQECLSLWKKHNPSAATLRKLLEILLRMRKEQIAVKVLKHYYPIIETNES